MSTEVLTTGPQVQEICVWRRTLCPLGPAGTRFRICAYVMNPGSQFGRCTVSVCRIRDLRTLPAARHGTDHAGPPAGCPRPLNPYGQVDRMRTESGNDLKWHAAAIPRRRWYSRGYGKPGRPGRENSSLGATSFRTGGCPLDAAASLRLQYTGTRVCTDSRPGRSPRGSHLGPEPADRGPGDAPAPPVSATGYP